MPNAPIPDASAHARRDMLARHGMIEADLKPKPSAAQRQVDKLAALPKSIAEAKGNARTFSKADMKRQAAAAEGVTASTPGRASMAKELRKLGLEPVRP